jgi:succinate-semialdehyde dehydrogenase / glutarate-semialdehyde dehydrogenase
MKSINPATEAVLAEYPEHSWEFIDRICAFSRGAFTSWRNTELKERCRLLLELGKVLRANRNKLAPLMTAEMGKPIVAAEAEVDKCALGCDYFAEHAGKYLKPQVIPSDASQSYLRFDPLGVVLGIMPWNFPIWQALRAAIPALAAGNVFLLKHAPNVPGCAIAIEKAFVEAGFPQGVFRSILTPDNAVAQRIASHPAIAAVTLTGSERAGSAVAAEAGKGLKKTVMELGGSDPFIVLADADISAVTKSAVEARCQNNGQSCIAAKRFIVEQSVAEEFESKFAAAMGALKVGDPMDRSTQVGPLARLDLLENLQRQVEQTIEQGAILRTGGRRRAAKGFFFEPTVLSGVRPGMTAFEEETFGPVAAVIRAENPAQAVELANETRYGLGASIWTSHPDRAQDLCGRIDAGSVFINGIVKTDARLPFGGVKKSGWGRELSEFGIREFVNVKTVWVR